MFVGAPIYTAILYGHDRFLDHVKIIAAIRQIKFLIADFTNNRGGVYYEAGFGKGIGREVIWTVRKNYLRHAHFDTRQYNFICWRPGDLAGFAKALQNRIEAQSVKAQLLS